jgi:hypothetical protein
MVLWGMLLKTVVKEEKRGHLGSHELMQLVLLLKGNFVST